MSDKPDEEMLSWLASQNGFYLLFFFSVGFLLALLMFVPMEIYYFFKNLPRKIRRRY